MLAQGTHAHLYKRFVHRLPDLIFGISFLCRFNPSIHPSVHPSIHPSTPLPIYPTTAAARELVNRVQKLRKRVGLKLTDAVEVYYHADAQGLTEVRMGGCLAS